MERGVRGGCHCGAVRFEAVLNEDRPQVLDCNCSICSKTGHLHLFVPHDDFELSTRGDALVSYRFGSRHAEHFFCRTCGIKSFYQPRSHPDCWSVNLRALDDPEAIDVDIVPFNGRNWEKAKAKL